MSLADLPRPIGFVLGGGGSLGAMQVGMLRALTEAGASPDLVTGTSVGSLNAAVLARSGGDALADLHGIWAHMTRAEAFPGGVLSRVRTLTQSKTHLFPNSGLAGIIADHLGAETRFEDLALPLGVVTTQVDTAEPLLIRSGRLLEPLLASCAIPGIFPPVAHEGRLLYDGGLVANVPMRQALAMGAKSLVVLDCAFPGKMPDAPRTFAEVIMFTAMISMRNQAVLEAPVAAASVPVVYLPGPAPVRVNPLDFGHTEALAEQAYEAAREYLDGLAVRGPGLYGAPGLVVT
ncbi:patatin-like phospholipase family protein [Amycolatopsis sp. SID8362]|uniref:patatin-like phospholipase family protein n=1 Tax=Amycolatopsis sp. SID8362 TaxID=2690346 RepID=UPI001369CE55|nr:patatin-like phospholipase family protein [Amycolatopsis sp. SID8362]NBH04522.1 patatin-like phospholipase family protein [Amycolatopsis sp. SID8362]NED41221.1 patatin-like phospholipase family protein [Amycolatopsis sp. SID8362]